MLALVLTALTVETVRAQDTTATEESISILVIDQTLALIPGQRDLVESLGTLFAFSYELGEKAVLFYDTEAANVVSGSGFQLRAEILSKLSLGQVSQNTRGADAEEALRKAVEYLDDQNAPASSRVIFMTAGVIEDNDNAAFESALEGVTRNGWRVDTIFLSTPRADNAFSPAVSATGGAELLAADNAGVESAIRYILNNGELEIGGEQEVVVREGTNLVLPFGIAPFSDSLDLVVFRENSGAGTGINIIQPDGTSLSRGSIIETPNFVIYNSPSDARPQEGPWEVRTQSGVAGRVSVHQRLENPVEPKILNSEFPIEREFALMVAIAMDGVIGLVDDVSIVATLTDDGTVEQNYMLLDDGTREDAVANDGIFTSLIAPLTGDQTSARVLLSLTWNQYGVTTQQEFDVPLVNFPEVNIKGVGDISVNPIGLWQFAELELELNGEAYRVAPDAVSAIFVGDNGVFAAEIGAINLNSEDQASRYRVWGAPLESDSYQLRVNLSLDYYEGFSTVFESDPFEVNVTTFVPSLNSRPSWLYGLQIWTPLLGLPLLIVLIYLLASMLTRPKPFGYLYDDQGKELVDFKGLKRSFWRRQFASMKVEASEFSKGALEGLEFKFAQSKKGGLNIQIRHIPGNGVSGLRIDDNPCEPSAYYDVRDGSWLGYSGRLIQVRYNKPTYSAKLGQDVKERE